MPRDASKLDSSLQTHLLLEALPKECRRDPAGVQLAQLVTQIAGKKVPVSSFSRVWALGSLQAQVSLGYFAYWVRSRFADQDQRQRLKSEAHLAAALKLFGTMGYLRGAVMKVGQMLANLPEVLPEEFAEVLSALHFEAPPMHFSMVREVFLDEFGCEPEQMFAFFDREAFAAASLGQVHRARLHSGEEVAVKIQYPGIARTIKVDLRNLRLLLQPMCLGKEWQDTLEKLTDIEHMLLMETDYEQEARFAKRARLLFSDADQVVVPQVYEKYCTKRVLTTEFLSGCHLDEYLARSPSQEERDHFTTLLTMATMRVYYRLHWIFADPHPGNMIFMEDGRLGVIDFGCTRAFSDEEWRISWEVEQAVLERDEERLNQLTAEACFYATPEEMGLDRLKTVRRGLDWQMEPWLHEGLFDFGDRAFFQRGIDCVVALARSRVSSGHACYLWTNRFILGGRAFCYRLKGRCDFAEISQQESAWVDQK